MSKSAHFTLVNPEVSDAYAEEAYDFHLKCAQKPQFSRGQVKRFLTRLVSSEKNIVELWADDKKIGCAALLDQVSNKHDASYIEFLGFSESSYLETGLALLFGYFENLARASGKHSGLVAAHNPTLPFSPAAILAQGFHPLYETFELVTRQRQRAQIPLPRGFELEELRLQDFSLWYELLVESFAQNPETAIGSLEEMRIGFEKAQTPTLVLKQGTRMVGFIKINIDRDRNLGEVSTLGVLPSHRHLGLGKFLLHEGLDRLWDLGAGSIELSVAAENKKALKLYTDAGFHLVEEYASFLKNL